MACYKMDQGFKSGHDICSVDVIIITLYVRIDYDGSVINVPLVLIIIPYQRGIKYNFMVM